MGGGQARELALTEGLGAGPGLGRDVASRLQMQQNGTVDWFAFGKKGLEGQGRLHFLQSPVHSQLKLSCADEFFMHPVC